MIKYLDDFLNKITMYRLVLYDLILLVVLAIVLSFFSLLPFNPTDLLFSTAFLLAIGWLTNALFAKIYEAPTNVESVYISGLILALIISPTVGVRDPFFLFWAAVLTMASKFILAIGYKHLFNPVALAVFLTSVTINQSANWWIGNMPMLPAVLLGGLLIVRKIKRSSLFFSFLITSGLMIGGFYLLKGINPLTSLQKTVFESPWIFFACIMLTEPLTTPPTKKLQILYGILVGFLFAPQIHFGSWYFTPEMALLLGNIFSYAVSSKTKLILKLQEKIKISPDVYDFIFKPDKKIAFFPGQYLEWTLGHENPDSRGNRRYFTIASSPTEENLRLGVKFYEKSSSFKKSFLSLSGNHEIVASQLSGDFTLPSNKEQKLVFVAGGIGITPFRSMLKYLLDIQEKRPIILFYSNRTAAEIIYQDVFNAAQKNLGIKVIYTLTDVNNLPPGWSGKTGRLSWQMIKEEIPDYRERIFYLSGAHAMVVSFEEILQKMGLPKNRIKIDYFPGFT